jgi:tripartite-type tricarboxylate transporter receptor subunit TctC
VNTMRKVKAWIAVGGAGCLLSASVNSVCAQTTSAYPVRPIRLIVPYPAAGQTDMLARSFNVPLGKRLGQPIVIDNRGGAATVIGAELASHAAPDGYTLLLATVTTLAVAPALSTKLPYRPEDFVPISMLASQPYALALYPGVPAMTVGQLVVYARANPGKLSFASAGVGTGAHLAGEMLKQMANINVVHVPYKGGAPALTDLLAGQVAYMFGNISGLVPHGQTGKLRILGVTSPRRSPSAPEIPTVAEGGLAGFSTNTWNSLVAPRGTPAAIAGRLNAEVNAVLNQPDVRDGLKKQGVDPEPGTQAQLSAHVKSEIARFTALIQFIGLQKVE